MRYYTRSQARARERATRQDEERRDRMVAQQFDLVQQAQTQGQAQVQAQGQAYGNIMYDRVGGANWRRTGPVTYAAQQFIHQLATQAGIQNALFPHIDQEDVNVLRCVFPLMRNPLLVDINSAYLCHLDCDERLPRVHHLSTTWKQRFNRGMDKPRSDLPQRHPCQYNGERIHQDRQPPRNWRRVRCCRGPKESLNHHGVTMYRPGRRESTDPADHMPLAYPAGGLSQHDRHHRVCDLCIEWGDRPFSTWRGRGMATARDKFTLSICNDCATTLAPARTTESCHCMEALWMCLDCKWAWHRRADKTMMMIREKLAHLQRDPVTNQLRYDNQPFIGGLTDNSQIHHCPCGNDLDPNRDTQFGACTLCFRPRCRQMPRSTRTWPPPRDRRPAYARFHLRFQPFVNLIRQPLPQAPQWHRSPAIRADNRDRYTFYWNTRIPIFD